MTPNETNAPLPSDAIPADEITYDGAPATDSGAMLEDKLIASEYPEAAESIAAPASEGSAPLEAVEEEPASLFTPLKVEKGPNPNCEIKASPTIPADPNVVYDEFTPHISGPRMTNADHRQLLEAIPQLGLDLGGEAREWADEVDEAAALLHPSGFMDDAAKRAGSKWMHRIPHASSQVGLGVTQPKLGSKISQGDVVSGDLAVLYAMSQLGSGASRNIQLWGSGIILTMRPPTGAARVELQQMIDQEKIELGRRAQGFPFSNESVYLKNYLVNFALAHVTNANVHYDSLDSLLRKIQTTDINTLIWGILLTSYPSAYPYYEPCVKDPTTCLHIEHSRLDLSKIEFVDYSRVTQYMADHMANRKEKRTDEELEAYRREVRGSISGEVTIKGVGASLRLMLEVPSAAAFIESGITWVESLVSDVQRAFGDKVAPNVRNALINNRAKATAMASYAHFIGSILLENGSVITDKDTIRKVLMSASDDRVLYVDLMQQVRKYLEDMSITMEAVVRHDCPACGGKPTRDEAEHPYLTPISVETLFFMMLGQLIEKVTS